MDVYVKTREQPHGIVPEEVYATLELATAAEGPFEDLGENHWANRTGVFVDKHEVVGT